MLEQLGFYKLADRLLIGDVLWFDSVNYYGRRDCLISGRNGMELVMVDCLATCRVWLHTESDFIDMWSAHLQTLESDSTGYWRTVPEMNVLAGCGRSVWRNAGHGALFRTDSDQPLYGWTSPSHQLEIRSR
jgi:hypothetical protein